MEKGVYKDPRWSNPDLDPIKPEDRTWGALVRLRAIIPMPTVTRTNLSASQDYWAYWASDLLGECWVNPTTSRHEADVRLLCCSTSTGFHNLRGHELGLHSPSDDPHHILRFPLVLGCFDIDGKDRCHISCSFPRPCPFHFRHVRQLPGNCPSRLCGSDVDSIALCSSRRLLEQLHHRHLAEFCQLSQSPTRECRPNFSRTLMLCKSEAYHHMSLSLTKGIRCCTGSSKRFWLACLSRNCGSSSS